MDKSLKGTFDSKTANPDNYQAVVLLDDLRDNQNKKTIPVYAVGNDGKGSIFEMDKSVLKRLQEAGVPQVPLDALDPNKMKAHSKEVAQNVFGEYQSSIPRLLGLYVRYDGDATTLAGKEYSEITGKDLPELRKEIKEMKTALQDELTEQRKEASVSTSLKGLEKAATDLDKLYRHAKLGDLSQYRKDLIDDVDRSAIFEPGEKKGIWDTIGVPTISPTSNTLFRPQ